MEVCWMLACVLLSCIRLSVGALRLLASLHLSRSGGWRMGRRVYLSEDEQAALGVAAGVS